MIKKSFSSLFVFSLILIGSFGFSHKVHAAPCVGNLGANTSTTVSSPTGLIQLSWDSTNCTTLFLEGVGSYSYQSVRSPVGSGNIPYDASGGTQTFYLYGTDINTGFTQSIASVTITYVAPQPATLTVNVVDENDTPLSGASWDIFGGTQNPSPSSGSGSSVSHTVYPAGGGSFFTVANYPSQIGSRDQLLITNSDFGSSPTILIAPGQSKWVKLKYSPPIFTPCSISLNTNTTSIVNGNSATLTWNSSYANTAPYTTGTNFNTGSAQSNSVGVSVSPTVTTTYSIRGYDSGPGCNDSVTITVTNPVPTINSFSATQGCVATTPKFDLNWSGTNVTGYTVQRNDSSGATIYSGTGTSYSDTGRTTGQTYAYYLVATGPGGSVNQTTTSSPAPNCTVPQPPSISNFTATPACNGTTPEMQLAWSATNNPTNYTVKRNNSGGATIYSSTGTSYTDGSLTPNTSYTYYLEVANGNAPNATQTASATTGSCVGQAPTVTITVAPPSGPSGTDSNINWSIGGGTATDCNLSAIPGNTQWTGTINGANVTAGGHVKTVTNITVTTTFSMTCNNASGSGSSSGSFTVSAAGAPAVTISASPSTVASGSSSYLTWSVNGTPTPTCTASGGWSGAQNTSGTNVSTGALFGNSAFTLTCTNSNGTGVDTANVTVTGGGLSNLVGGTLTTTSVIANDPSTRVFAPITNSGGSNTSPSSWWYTFQITNAANGGGSLIAQPAAPFSGTLTPNQTALFNVSYTFTANGPYSARICADTTGAIGTGPSPTLTGGLVNETTDADNCGPWGNINVTSGTMDVLAGPTYTTTPAGVNNMQNWWYFGAYVKNQGTGATPGSGFPNIGQLATQTNGGGTITNFSYAFPSAIAPGAQWGTSFGTGYAFTSPGTYSTRVCADATGVSGNTATGGVLTETDENNNCGPWTDLVVTMDATTNTAAYINVYSNLPSSWDIVPWPSSGQTVSPTSGSGTQSNHIASGNSWAYTLSNIAALSGYTYTVTPSSMQAIYNGRTTSYWINYVSSGGFDYSLSNGGTVSATKSSVPVNTQATITKTLTSGASQSVDITATGMPSGVSIAYANRACSPTCASTITFTVDPTAPAGTYPITITANTSGLADKTTTFNLVISNPVTLTVTCTPSPSPAYVGQPVTWTGTVVGGTGPYSYAWTGTDFGTGTTNPFVFTYQSTGTKSAVLTVADSLSASGSCPQTNLGVTIDPKYKEF